MEEGRTRLGFDRMGIWFLSDDRQTMLGSYGTDAYGKTMDERHYNFQVDDNFVGRSFPAGESFSVEEDKILTDVKGRVLGRGWKALSALWNGDEVVGYLSADNLINQQPLTSQQRELLILYGSTLGHLLTRIRAEEILHSYQENLKVLHRIGVDLSKAETFDDFCRQAVEEGRSRLGFDRLSLWFMGDEPGQMIGSFGTDADGKTTDERQDQHTIKPEYFRTAFPTGDSLVINDNVDLIDSRGEVLGKGWAVMALMRSGDEVVGYLSADNLLNQKPLSPQQQELLTLYGSTLGHLATRIRAEETLLRQQNAEKAFQEQLKRINQISIDLAQCETFDDVCRQAIEMGREQLGFDRMSLWFIDKDDPRILHGTFGTNEIGDIRDERQAQFLIPDLAGSATHRVLTGDSFAELDRDFELRDDRHQVVGYGSLSVTALRDGQQVIGCLYADNFFNRQPIDQYQTELLTLYGATLGHLAKRKWIEETLRRSEERYRTIFEDASIGISLANQHGNPVSSNPTYSAMLGYTPEELSKMTFAEFTHPDDRDKNLDLFNKLIAGEIEHYQIEKRYLCKNGDTIWARIDASQFPGSSDDELLAVALVQDITAQKKAVADLQSSEARFRAIFEGSRIGITVLNKRGCSVSCNPTYAAMLEYSRDELSEIPFVEFTHPEDREKSSTLFQTVVDGKNNHQQFETRYIQKNGEVVWIRMNISPFPVSDQNEKLIIAIAEDISDIKKAETSLRDSEARNRALLAAIPDMIFVQDHDGILVDYHAPTQDDLFTSPDNFLFKRFADVLPSESVRAIQPAFDAAVKNGDIQVIEYPLPESDETRYFEARMIAYGDDRVLSMIRDVTERKQIEQQNLELAVQRERVNIIADFIRDASHEFRTPLSVINSQVYLAMHLDDAEARREQLGGIREQSEVILKLVESLVTMSRLDSDMSMKYMPVGIGDILRALHTGFQKRADNNGVTFVLEQDDDLPWVPGDNDDLYRAFYNVVDNAMRYTAANGTITIRARRVSADRFEVEIRDSGCGIEDNDLPHIFERFFRGDRAHSTPGFGLGLPVTRRIIERHGGHIEVESEVGTGSTFTISLPLRNSQYDVDAAAQAHIT